MTQDTVFLEPKWRAIVGAALVGELQLWAVRSKIIPIKDRKHQLNTYHYIHKHINEGAWLWDFRRSVIFKIEIVTESPGTEVPGESPHA